MSSQMKNGFKTQGDVETDWEELREDWDRVNAKFLWQSIAIQWSPKKATITIKLLFLSGNLQTRAVFCLVKSLVADYAAIWT